MSTNREIIIRGEAVLQKKAVPVENPSELKPLADEMREAMEAHDGIGIAAPQVGESLRLFLVAKNLFPQEAQEKLPTEVFVNPKAIRRAFKRVAAEEGCLSVPGVFGMVERALRITVEAQDLEGKKFRVAADGLLARVLQHELDHLNGVLFVDKAKPETLHKISPDGTAQPWKP